MKFQKGDLVRDNRAGGFGNRASSRMALVIRTHEDRGYYLYLIEGSERCWRPEIMVISPDTKDIQRIKPRLKRWLDALGEFNLTYNPIMAETCDALEIAVLNS